MVRADSMNSPRRHHPDAGATLGWEVRGVAGDDDSHPSRARRTASISALTSSRVSRSAPVSRAPCCKAATACCARACRSAASDVSSVDAVVADRTATGFPFDVTTKSFSRARERHTVADRLHKSRMLTNSTISLPGLLGALSRTRQSLYATATSINPRQPPLRRAGRMNARSCSVSRPQLRPTSTPQAALPAVAAIPRSLSSTGSSNGRDASAPTSSIRTRRTPPWRPRIGRGRFARMWPPAPPRTDRENTGTPPWISWTRQGAAR